MNEASILDIISPIMVGPSSSHTAGAVKIGLLARNIYGAEFKKVKITLYNSYAQTGIGHGTDKGILAGLLGYSVDNTIIKRIFDTEDALKVEYSFEHLDSFSRHPNAVDIYFEGERNMFVSAKSVGGGEIIIDKIDEFDVSLNGKLDTIAVIYNDIPGMLSSITNVINEYKINIAELNCTRQTRGQLASCIITLDNRAKIEVIEKIKNKINPEFIRYIEKLNY